MKALITLFLLISLTATISYGQQHPDSLKRTEQPSPENPEKIEHAWYKKSLGIDSVKAEQIARIHSEYKAGMKAIAADTGLSLEARREKIKAFMEENNKKIAAILGPGRQQEKIIPTTEPKPSTGSKKD